MNSMPWTPIPKTSETPELPTLRAENGDLLFRVILWEGEPTRILDAYREAGFDGIAVDTTTELPWSPRTIFEAGPDGYLLRLTTALVRRGIRFELFPAVKG